MGTKPMFVFSTEALDTIGFWTMIAGAVLGGVGLIASTISAVSLYKSSSRTQAEASERISKNEAETEQAKANAAKSLAAANQAEANLAGANERAAKAEEKAATAQADAERARKSMAEVNERAARWEMEAAEARLEQEKLRAAVAWRVLSPPMANAMSSALSQRSGTMTVVYPPNDPEAQAFAIQISNLFSSLGWTARPEARAYQGLVFFNLIIPPGEDSTAIDAVRGAFRAAGLSFSSDPLPPTGGFIGNFTSMQPSSVSVFVGSRPPAI